MECLALWPSYIGEKGRTLGKTYEIKERCYWEPIGNPLGTHWELMEYVERLMGTHWNLKGTFLGTKEK
jgi:hypothetical protein